MPPKKKTTEVRGDEPGAEGIDADFSVSSPLSAATTASAGPSLVMTTDQLQLVLESVLARFTPSVAHGVGSSPAPSPSPKINTIPVPKWTDEESPWDYFSKYEQAQKHNAVPRAEWGPLLQVYLAGKAQLAFAQVDSEKLDDFYLVKETMLRSLGDTPEEADRRWWTLRRRKGETSGAFYLRMRSTANRRFFGILTRDDMFNKVLLSRFMALLPPECYNCISAKHPRTAEEAAEMVADYESKETFSKTYLSGDSTDLHPQQQHHYKREQSVFSNNLQGGDSSQGIVSSQPVSSSSNGSGPSSFNCQNVGQNYQGEKGIKQEKLEERERKPIVCFGCGEAGHIRPNCPNRMRAVREEGVESGILVDGFLAGIEAKGLRIDTGSGRTVVHPDFVPSEAYTGREIILDTWRGGQFSKHRVARIAIQVGSVEKVAEVAVDENVKYPALLGMDLGKKLRVEMMSLLLHKLENNPPIESEREQQAQATPIVITSVENERQSLEEKAVEAVVAQAVSEPVNLSDIFYFDDEFF